MAGHQRRKRTSKLPGGYSDEITGSWPVVIPLKALGIAGHAAASSAVAGTVMGCRVSRFKDVAEAALEYLNRKVEEAKSKPD